MSDRIERLFHSIIQHGPLNNRIYLMKLDNRDYPRILKKLDELAYKKGYTKIFAKIPFWAVKQATDHGYITEARIPNMFDNSIDGYFLGKFLDEPRMKIDKKNSDLIKKVKQKFQACVPKPDSKYSLDNGIIKPLSKIEIASLSEIYKTVFESYPFPIYKVSHLEKMMDNNVKYYGVFQNNRLIAASAAEMDREHKCVEMTDFATLPQSRGNNYAFHLLNCMEEEMKRAEMKIAYTIARSISFGINITFAKAGYHYGGLLRNNTAIAGSLESMNVLYKNLTN
jgi:beta-lysine N6-acetyltransferase